jgi:hypothetical protein
MSLPSSLSPAERRLFHRRAALAPLCLCLVAGLHVVRVWTCHQTPWKGGGFGMFSTVDDESARFLRCYLVTEKGDLALSVPPAADKAVAELRAAPTQARLDDLARRLSEQSWGWSDERKIREVAAFQQRSALFREELRPAISGGHTIEPIPQDETPTGAIPFQSVRVECLRYRFDASSRTLRAEPILIAESKGTP